VSSEAETTDRGADFRQKEHHIMSALHELTCVPCRGGEPTLTDAEIAELAPQTPEWLIIQRDGERRLERVFRFQDFASALAFANTIGAAAEEQGHHPALLVEWGKLTVTWWTHAIGGLHRNDFIMAARTDALYESAVGRKG
jgi:4a-hydroxytetrahydrobiopterin dehydratase